MKKEIVLTSGQVNKFKTYHSGKEMKEGDNAAVVMIHPKDYESEIIIIHMSEVGEKYKINEYNPFHLDCVTVL